MTEFAEKIEQLLARHKLTGTEISERAGFSDAQFSKWRRGEQSSITESDFKALAHAISDDEHEHAELLRAHLLDECHGPGAELIKVEIERGSLNDAPRRLTELERAFLFLRREIPQNRPLRDVVIDLARALGMPSDASLSAPQLTRKPAKLKNREKN